MSFGSNCKFCVVCYMVHQKKKKHNKPNQTKPTEHYWFLHCDHRKHCKAAEMRFPLHQQPYLPLLPGWAGGAVGPGPARPATGWAVPAPGVPPGTLMLPVGKATALPVPPGPCPALSAAGAEPQTCGSSSVAEEHRVSPEAPRSAGGSLAAAQTEAVAPSILAGPPPASARAHGFQRPGTLPLVHRPGSAATSA